MARITILIALLAALALVVHTSASRYEHSCKRVNLRHCEKLVSQRIQQQQEEEEDHLRRIKHVIRRSWAWNSDESQEQEEQEEMEQCCEQLNKLNRKRCQCRALQHIYEKQSEQLEGREQEKQLEKELEKLPNICGFGPLPQCDVNPNED